MSKPVSVASLLILSETEAQLMAAGVSVGASVAEGVDVGVGVGVGAGATYLAQPKAAVASVIISKAVTCIANFFIALALQVDEL